MGAAASTGVNTATSGGNWRPDEGAGHVAEVLLLWLLDVVVGVEVILLER
jgi:hypothetical protein